MKFNRISLLWDALEYIDLEDLEDTISYKIFLLLYGIGLIFILYYNYNIYSLEILEEATLLWIILVLPTFYFSLNEIYNVCHKDTTKK